MLTIIVVYLLYSSSVNGKLVGQSCLEPHFTCLRQNDCCSNYCRIINEEAFGTCASEANAYFPPSIIKMNTCFKSGHFCFIDADCCSNICIAWAGLTYRECLAITTPKNVATSCTMNNNDCFKDEDCCSNNCSKVPEKDFGTCISKKTKSTIEKECCIKTGHFCLSHADCCTGRCVLVYPKLLHIKVHACRDSSS
ncbi:hypothetical protein KQX54_019143 [Cotesia glomerata]|uniref:Venom protein n=1 Tax=Cotesia glomerata TaxID=32391 RepID=A0AAV7I4C6_COTGL|nr:hypothetical protein KQX54_019143 [Cotesia glomerata]